MPARLLYKAPGVGLLVPPALAPGSLLLVAGPAAGTRWLNHWGSQIVGGCESLTCPAVVHPAHVAQHQSGRHSMCCSAAVSLTAGSCIIRPPSSSAPTGPGSPAPCTPCCRRSGRPHPWPLAASGRRTPVPGRRAWLLLGAPRAPCAAPHSLGPMTASQPRLPPRWRVHGHAFSMSGSTSDCWLAGTACGEQTRWSEDRILVAGARQ